MWYVCTPTSREVETGGLSGQPRLQGKIVSKETYKKCGLDLCLTECLPSMYTVLGLIPVLCKPGEVVHAWNPSSMEVETEGPAFKVILYTVVSLRLA